MNTFTVHDNAGLYTYAVSGLTRLMSAAMILFFCAGVAFYLYDYKGIPEFKRGPGAGFYAGIAGAVWFLYMHTRRVEVYFIGQKNYVERVFSVYGIKFRTLFRLDEVSLVSQSKETRYGEYDNLYLVDKAGKRYFIGQSYDFESETVALLAASISRHCGVAYDHES